MSDETYYVKIRGRVLGPFHTDRLIEMVSQGKLSRVHMLSTDNQNWQKASEYPDLFQSAGRTTSSAMKPETQNAPTSPGLDSGDVWHYGINGQPQGPVSKSVIMSLFTSGQLTASDSLWREGMDDWQPLSSVPEFSNALQVPQSVQVPQNVQVPQPGSRFCTHCGAPCQVNQAVCLKCGMSLDLPPAAGNNYGNQGNNYGNQIPQSNSNLIYPSSPPKDPLLMGLLSGCCIAGLGQIVLGQVVKGIVLIVVAILLAAATAGISALFMFPLMGIDAYLVAKKLKNGNAVTQWECF